jgi:hypothetical protein
MYITEPHADIMAFLGPPAQREQREQDARLFTSGAHLPCGALSGGEFRCVQPTVREIDRRLRRQLTSVRAAMPEWSP